MLPYLISKVMPASLSEPQRQILSPSERLLVQWQYGPRVPVNTVDVQVETSVAQCEGNLVPSLICDVDGKGLREDGLRLAVLKAKFLSTTAALYLQHPKW